MASETKSLTVKIGRVAPSYERVHYVHHYLYNPNLTVDNMMPFAGKIEDAIFEETGYLARLVDIQVRHFYDLYTDVDFVIDSPSESPIAPAVIVAILKAIALIIALIAILGVIVLIYITVYSEKYKVYYCDQHDPPLAFEGAQVYAAHLAEFHPEKYKAWKEAGENWWERLVSLAPLLIFGVIIVALAPVAEKLIPERRRE